MSNSQPIGIFDSGIGGTSIFKEIQKILPNENIIYLADSKNAPYGNKSGVVIQELSTKNTELLLNLNCKLIVVACNTATTNAIASLRKNYNVPFIGIEPAIKPATIETKTKSIGILATKGTLSSALFHDTMNKYKRDIKIVESIGNGIVELIEKDRLHSDEMRNLLIQYLKPMLHANIDRLVLGCTHYPYLIPVLKTLLPEHVKIIDSGLAVAKQTKAILEKNKLLSTDNDPVSVKFFTNTNTKTLDKFIGEKYKSQYLDF